MQRIGVLGASFNPPTLGHQDVVYQALPYFDEILLVPSLSHPFQKYLGSIEDRLEMLGIFVEYWQDLDNQKKVKILNIEADIQKTLPPNSPIYTYDVLCAIQALYPTSQCQIRFIIGPDNANKSIWQKFYRYKEIEENWPLFIAKERVPIHSTMVREFITNTQNASPACLQGLAELVGFPIARYIVQHQLYTQKE